MDKDTPGVNDYLEDQDGDIVRASRQQPVYRYLM
jgi:hypothetical protein